jgi:uncharacterized protein YjdB
MSDDSFFDIGKAKVNYKSNNPDVVSVDEKGTVTAKAVGTASIFASVTVNGKTLSASYPLKVLPDLKPASIEVNRKDITGFSPEIKAYSYLLKDGSVIPDVSATSAGNDISVDIVQAKAVPGTAVITLTDNITLEKNSCDVNFGTDR